MINGRTIKFIEILIVFSIAATNLMPDLNKFSELYISSPQQGEVLSGIVPIRGSADDTELKKYEIAFSYDMNSSSTWFPINTSKQNVNTGLLAEWDTNGITDGDYQIRVQLFLKDGTIKEVIIRHLFIRNYTIDEIVTSVNPSDTETPGLFNLSTSTYEVEATSLAANPITISSPRVLLSLVIGVSTIIFLIVVIWIYNRFKIK